MTYDFNTSKTKREEFSDSLVKLIDAGIAAEVETPRTHLGASQIGDECLRRIQYEITGTPGAPFEGKTRRIFHRGHQGEEWVAEWLRKAGFTLWTVAPDGHQHGFIHANGRFRGHIDGVLMGGSPLLSYPALWENKVLGAKGWRSVAKDGVAKAYPKYADQVALYQAYMNLTEFPCLFTALNADTMEIWCELVPFDTARAQAASDRAAKILQATAAGEWLPRASSSSDGFPCSFCRFREVCWA